MPPDTISCIGRLKPPPRKAIDHAAKEVGGEAVARGASDWAHEYGLKRCKELGGAQLGNGFVGEGVVGGETND
eukprot:CAMPEP_0174746756 /NCGR_PEP_ID=MMETSP1094-20130205/89782_1 /TAXON_ID=156173 /ORGANISM="Chrysochromulina brevifilum, Strain UTEX LB 985" /LENGTH=72 /DNA_ID=CAMNT_0015951523 /DNA_START=158 /DNA_END=373 /DNA_ORIENTATION=-